MKSLVDQLASAKNSSISVPARSQFNFKVYVCFPEGLTASEVPCRIEIFVIH